MFSLCLHFLFNDSFLFWRPGHGVKERRRSGRGSQACEDEDMLDMFVKLQGSLIDAAKREARREPKLQGERCSERREVSRGLSEAPQAPQASQAPQEPYFCQGCGGKAREGLSGWLAQVMPSFRFCQFCGTALHPEVWGA